MRGRRSSKLRAVSVRKRKLGPTEAGLAPGRAVRGGQLKALLPSFPAVRPRGALTGDDGDGWMAGLLLTRGEKRDTESDQLTHLHTTSFFSQPAPRQLTNRQTKRREERTSELMERPRTPPAPEH